MAVVLNIIAIAIILSLTVPTFGQETVLWSYQTGSAALDRVFAVAADPNNKDVVIAGPAQGAVNGQSFVGNRDWVAVKLDTNGAVQWTYQAGEVGSWSELHDVFIDGSSNVFLVGQHQGTLFGASIGGYDLAVVKLNSAGVLQWSYTQGSIAQDRATCVAIDSSGNVIVGGWVKDAVSGESFGGGGSDGVLLKLNSAGVQQWLMQTEFGTSGLDEINDLAIDGSDNILVIGRTGGAFGGNTNAGSDDAFIVKTDTAGVFQWSYQIGTASSELGNGIGILPSGDIIGAGITYGSLPGNTNVGSGMDGFIVKLNAAGVQQWVVQIGTATDSTDQIVGLAVHPSSGNFAVYGQTNGDFNGDTNAGSGSDLVAAEYDTTGALRWSYQYGAAAGGEVLSGGAYDSAGDLILGGEAATFYSNTAQGASDMVAVKLAPPTSTSTSESTTSTSATSTSTSITSTTSATTTSTSITSTTSTSATSTSTSITSTTSTSATSTSTSATSTSTSGTSTSTSATSTSTTSASTTSTTSTITTSSSSISTMTSSTASGAATTSTATLPGSSDPGSPDPSSPDPGSPDPGSPDPGSPNPTSLGSGDPNVATTTTSTSTTGTVRLTRTEIRAMEVQRRAKAAATVAKLQVAEATALELVVPQLNSSQLQLPVVPVETELGMLNATMLYVGQLELLGGVIIYAEGGEGTAFVEVSAVTVEEILVSDGLTREDPLLLSVVAMNDTTNFEQDAITGEASILSSLATLSINVWRSDGTRIAVNSLENPLQFTLEVTDADVSCAFWDEDVAKWSADGVTTIASTNSSLACSTRHLTIFAGIKDVFLKNVVLAFTCSTLSGLFTEPAFANLLITNWLWSTPSILNMVFHGLGVVCVLLAWCYDRKQEAVVPWTEREVILMRVKKDEKVEEEEEDLDDGDAPPPSRCTRCMDCFNHSMEYVSHATGGDATVEAVKELAGNADVAAVNRAISTLQSHKAGISRAQIAVFNQQNTKKAVELQRSTSNLQSSQPQLRRMSTTASEVLVKTADHGQVAAQAFLRRGLLCRVATLWPAAHPWSKAVHFSMLAPVRASVALVVLKIISAGALSAVFFSSSSPGPDSDPECKPPQSPIAQAVQSLTVGLVTALLSDVIVSILFAIQVKKVVFSKTEWTEEKKRRQHFRWNMWTIIFWLILFLYGGFCNLYICLFFANVTDQDRLDWLHSMGVAMLDDLLVKSFLAAFAMATIATLVLCCRPKVIEKIHAKWIKDGKDDANEAVNSVNHEAEPKDGTETETPELPSKEVEGPGDATSEPDAKEMGAGKSGEILHVSLDADPEEPEGSEAPETHKVDADEMDLSCETLRQETV